jgi:hypothetical protein
MSEKRSGLLAPAILHFMFSTLLRAFSPSCFSRAATAANDRGFSRRGMYSFFRLTLSALGKQNGHPEGWPLLACAVVRLDEKTLFTARSSS